MIKHFNVNKSIKPHMFLATDAILQSFQIIQQASLLCRKHERQTTLQPMLTLKAEPFIHSQKSL